MQDQLHPGVRGESVQLLCAARRFPLFPARLAVLSAPSPARQTHRQQMQQKKVSTTNFDQLLQHFVEQ